MGALLVGTANRIRVAFETNNEHELHMAMQKLGTYFCIMGIIAMIALVFMAVVILIPLAAVAL